jgi:hypothetical protein
MWEDLSIAAAIVLGSVLAVLALYLCMRVMGKAWYRSKREEEGAERRRTNNNLKNNRGGNSYGKG